ncbi:hypothetical protein NDU88_008222 [Pleurodeles waltl]|uniref:Uncharacterized protein n=1 Tax=Pleurodeles waltl TaxID=8319 RepID=A0AAV7QQ48_PLEWA|nr:hypothetical protein NDU88_008222 [Pleurodeles waltl]
MSRQTVGCVLKREIQNVIAAATGLAELVKTLPSTLKINMAPKSDRNSCDKAQGTKTTCAGKDKGDPAGVVRRPIMIMVKSRGKNTTVVGRDVKNDDGIIPPLDARGKDKIQPTITSFLAVGVQESYTEHIVPPPANSRFVIEAVPSGTSRERVTIKTNEPLIKVSQGDDGLPGVLDSSVVTKKKGSGFPIRKNGHQAQRSKILAGGEAVGDMDDTTITLSTEVLQFVSPKLTVGDRETEKSLKHPDWAKDGGDKFYSLTEESDLTSSEHILSESGSSISSETGNISSSNKPTVWLQRQHRKCTKVRSGSSEGTELSTFSGSKTLKWDYSGNRLTDLSTANGQQMSNNNMEGNIGGPASSTCTASVESGMLQSIYNSIKELQTETRIENRRARVATKRLQGTVRKVAKSCTEIEAKLNTMEEWTVAVKADVEALREQCVTQDGQMTGIMWKLKDHENQQRRNNLRFLGINEGAEGSNIWAHMIKLLRGGPFRSLSIGTGKLRFSVYIGSR